jgi:hypothetical protein
VPAAVAVLDLPLELVEPDAPAELSSLFLRLMEPSLDLEESPPCSGECTAGSYGCPCLGTGGGRADSRIASPFWDDGLLFFLSRFGATGDPLLFGREFGRDASRSDCADACAAILAGERPACETTRSSTASTYGNDSLDDNRGGGGRDGPIVAATPSHGPRRVDFCVAVNGLPLLYALVHMRRRLSRLAAAITTAVEACPLPDPGVRRAPAE